MSITHITSLTQLNGILGKSKDKLTVIDFHATWCGPCHAIAPTFEGFAKKYTNVNFLKCDVDAAQEVAKEYSVSAMPTFIFLKCKSKVDMVRGADRSGLERAIQKHSSGSAGSSGAFTGHGRTLGGGPVAPSIADEVKGVVDKAGASFGQIDPQMKLLFVLVGLYGLFWYCS